jgi:hypothetical protein
MAWYLISETKFTFTFNMSQIVSKSGNIICTVLLADSWQYMTKILVITFEQYAPRKSENVKKENIIFCMLDSAHGIIHLSVHHRTTYKYVFKVKVLSQKFLQSTIPTNIWGRKIQDLYNDRYLKIFNYNSAALFLCVGGRGGYRGCMTIILQW